MFSAFKRKIKSRYYAATGQKSKYYENVLDGERAEAKKRRSDYQARQRAVNRAASTREDRQFMNERLNSAMKKKEATDKIKAEKRAQIMRNIKTKAKAAGKTLPGDLLHAGKVAIGKSKPLKAPVKPKVKAVNGIPSSVIVSGNEYKKSGSYNQFTEIGSLEEAVKRKKAAGYKTATRKGTTSNGVRVVTLYVYKPAGQLAAKRRVRRTRR